VNSPRWSDDELLRELGAALADPPAGDAVTHAARAAFAWRTVDQDLEILTLADSELTAGALVRGTGPGAPRTFGFHGARLGVEIEIDETGILGQLIPPQPGQVTLVTSAGPQAMTQADEVGCFSFPLPARGPLRLDCRLGADHFVTEWITT
jgi:hypothetical protein